MVAVLLEICAEKGAREQSHARTDILGFLPLLLVCQRENWSGCGAEKGGTGLGRPLASTVAGQDVLVMLVAMSPRQPRTPSLVLHVPRAEVSLCAFDSCRLSMWEPYLKPDPEQRGTFIAGSCLCLPPGAVGTLSPPLSCPPWH